LQQLTRNGLVFDQLDEAQSIATLPHREPPSCTAKSRVYRQE
jgi:hypothetical protein